MARYGVSYEKVDKIYIAGGFGCQLDIHKAVGIGMFQELFMEHICFEKIILTVILKDV